MKKFEVCLEGTFVTEIVIEAESEDQAIKLAKDKLDKSISLSLEEYTVDTATVESHN